MKKCVNGVCLDGLCYCNDGFGGKGCDLPGECLFVSFRFFPCRISPSPDFTSATFYSLAVECQTEKKKLEEENSLFRANSLLFRSLLLDGKHLC